MKTLKNMKSDINKYKKFIIVDEDYRPMAWSVDQLCYCTNSDYHDEHHPVRVYTKGHANRLITRSQMFRKGNGWDVPKYKLMPVAK